MFFTLHRIFSDFSFSFSLRRRKFFFSDFLHKTFRAVSGFFIPCKLCYIFKFDDASLSAHAVEELDVLAEWMHVHPHTTIVIHGYSDVSEAITSENVIRDEEYAVALSKRRAEAVRSVLVDRDNISPERIRIIPHSAERDSSYSDKYTTDELL